jgi:exonuclease VII large subunit
VEAAMSGRLHRMRARVGAVESRPGYAGFATRIAMRGRRADDLTHQLLRALRGRLAHRERAYQALRLALETFDVPPAIQRHSNASRIRRWALAFISRSTCSYR